jgi:hypothetical protein
MEIGNPRQECSPQKHIHTQKGREKCEIGIVHIVRPPAQKERIMRKKSRVTKEERV